MYNKFRNWCERVLRIPDDPEPPPGDEGSARVFRAAPNYYKYLLVIWAITTAGILAAFLPAAIAPAAIAAALARKHHSFAAVALTLPTLLFCAGIVLRIFSLALVRLNFEKRCYIVTDRSLRVREGIMNVREMTVTFANIQNISISQGPMQRAIGIADLRVDTAGGGGGGGHDRKHQGEDLHTAWFRGVSNANEIRQLIQDRLRRSKDSGLGDHDDERHGHELPAATPDLIAALRQVAAEASALRTAVADTT